MYPPGHPAHPHPAMSDSEEVEVEVVETPATRRGRPGMESLLHRPGPAILVVVVVSPEGRWAAELTAPSAEARAASELLQQVLHTGDTSLRPAHESPRVIGIAALVSWEYVREEASSKDTHLLMMASNSAGRHKRMSFRHFLEHRILAAAIFEEPVPMPGFTCWAATAGIWPAVLDPSTAAAVATRPALLTAGPSARGRMPASQALSIWASCFEASSTSLTPWPAWTPLATALIEGRWAGDVTWVARGQCIPPVAPPRGQLQAFQREQLQNVPAAHRDSQASSSFSVLDPRRGSIQPFSAAHAINCLRMGAALRSQANMSQATVAALRFWFPDEWPRLLAARQQAGFRCPKSNVVRGMRVGLDIAAMLLWRQWYHQHRPTYRYIGVDASPQKPGVEVLAVVERVIPRRALGELQPGQLWPTGLIQRRLPISCLGHGRARLADKVQAVVHATWLEYGPSLVTLAQANLDVRQVLTDMGTELGIADAAAVGSLCAPTKPRPSWSSSSRPGLDLCAFLYPLALGVPGMQHILDSILKDSLVALSWWPTWQASAKDLSQWLGYANHLEFLEAGWPASGGALRKPRKPCATAVTPSQPGDGTPWPRSPRTCAALKGQCAQPWAPSAAPQSLAAGTAPTHRQFGRRPTMRSFGPRPMGSGCWSTPSRSYRAGSAAALATRQSSATARRSSAHGKGAALGSWRPASGLSSRPSRPFATRPPRAPAWAWALGPPPVRPVGPDQMPA